MKDKHFLIEQIKTIHNLTEIALLLMDREDLLYTVLELIFVESQNMNDEFCVVNP